MRLLIQSRMGGPLANDAIQWHDSSAGRPFWFSDPDCADIRLLSNDSQQPSGSFTLQHLASLPEYTVKRVCCSSASSQVDSSRLWSVIVCPFRTYMLILMSLNATGTDKEIDGDIDGESLIISSDEEDTSDAPGPCSGRGPIIVRQVTERGIIQEDNALG